MGKGLMLHIQRTTLAAQADGGRYWRKMRHIDQETDAAALGSAPEVTVMQKASPRCDVEVELTRAGMLWCGVRGRES